MRERSPIPTPQEAIRRHVEGADDWEWQEIASQLYIWTDRFNDRFWERQMPEAVLSFERMDHRILAAYTLRRNAQGLLYEITFNVKHLERPLWETLETLMHEYVHLWQQNYGQHPVSRNYHNEEFVGACEAIGLHPLIGAGVHVRPADGRFAEFLRAYGVPEPDPLAEPVVSPKGKPLDWWADPEARPRHRRIPMRCRRVTRGGSRRRSSGRTCLSPPTSPESGKSCVDAPAVSQFSASRLQYCSQPFSRPNRITIPFQRYKPRHRTTLAHWHPSSSR